MVTTEEEYARNNGEEALVSKRIVIVNTERDNGI